MQNDEGKIQKTDGKHLTSRPSPQGGEGGKVAVRQEIPAWWLTVPQSEKDVIRDLVASIRGLKRSKSPQVAQAARKWERGIVCFIRFRLMSASPHGRRAITSTPASSRNPRGVSPARD